VERLVRADQLQAGDRITIAGRTETVDHVATGVQFATVCTDHDDHVLRVGQKFVVDR
jgi:hypothetical protein